MEIRSHRTTNSSLPAQYITLILAAWLFASGTMNAINYDTPSYFTVSHAGLEGFFPLFLLWSAISALFIWLLTKVPAASGKSHDSGQGIPGRLLYLAWIVFSWSLFLHIGSSLALVSLALVNLISLILGRDIFRSAWKTRWLPDIGLALAGFALVLYNLLAIPWPELWLHLLGATGGDDPALLLLAATWLALGLLVFLGLRQPKPALPAWLIPLLAVSVFLLQSFLIGRIMYARVVSLSTPTYDFNLFAQMFHNMAETFQPLTTLERNMPLSHFKVHLSPVYYLLLPFYMIFRSPQALNVFQAFIVASGVFPLILIARRLHLPAFIQAVFAVIFLVSTPLIASNFYDLHENCFLVPFLLWLIYFIEKKSSPGIALFTLLTLAVKEDAALYIWALAAFMIFERRMLRQGLAMLLAAGGYFVWAVTYLNQYGDGAMTGRFHNLIGVPQWSLLSVPYSLWRNPGFVLAKILQPEKLNYLIQMLAPLGFIPLLSRSLSRWILIIPFLLMNLMVDYPYQFDIRFQYNYGPYILMLYLAMLWTADYYDTAHTRAMDASRQSPSSKIPAAGLIPAWARILFALAIASGLLLSSAHLLDYESYPRQLRVEADRLASMKLVMDTIPDSSSVLASDFLTGYLSEREAIYDISYNVTDSSYYPADFIVIDLRPGFSKEHEALVPRFLSDGYVIRKHRSGEILLLEQTGIPRLDLE